ncbi:MAG: recombinase family protein [Clostridiales bacterium]|nr:recombinase family protein [Clostridiales bacterium]
MNETPKVRVIPANLQTAENRNPYQQLRVAAYCRVSTEQEEQQNSYQVQISYYTDLINRKKEWTLVKVFADEGISGTQAKKRPEFLKMIRMCKQQKIDLIITKSISRFARNTVDCLNYIRELKEMNIPVYFEKESINTMDAKGEVLLTIMASLAQQESESLSKNVKLGMQYRFQQGKIMVNTTCFLGYDKDDKGNFVINPKQAEVVKRIFREYLEGKSILAICRGLEHDKIKTSRGNKRWHDSSVRKILENEKYMGDALLQKTYTVDFLNKKRVKNTGIMPQYYVEDSHPAIIPKEIFMQVQEEIARRGMLKDVHVRRKCFSAAHAFSQITFCADCGAEFSRLHWNNRGKKSIVWRCSKRVEDYTKCSARTIKEDDLQQAFVEALQTMIGDSDNYIKKPKTNLYQIIVDPGVLQNIDNRLNKLQHELIDRTERHEDYSDIAEETFALRKQREKVQVSKSSQAEYKKRIKELQFFIKSQPKQMEFDETFAKHLLSKITVFDENIVFEFKSGVTVSVEM